MIKTTLGLLTSFGKIGLISLGGGNSMLKLIEYEAITVRQWVGQEEFIQMVGTTFLFPGLTAVKLAGLIGYKASGFLGLAIAILAINLPGIILALVGFYLLSSVQNPLIHKIMVGVQYGALVLLAAASFSIAKGVIALYFSWPLAVLSLVFFLALVFLPLSPFWGFIAFIGACFFIVHI